MQWNANQLHAMIQNAGEMEFFIGGRIICLQDSLCCGIYAFKVFHIAYNEPPLQCILNTASVQLHNIRHLYTVGDIYPHTRTSE